MTESEDHPGVHSPRDGDMDFTGYTDSQLRDLRLHLDAIRFPVNFQKLEEEMLRRGKAGHGLRVVVHHTSAGGFIGWLQALFLLQRFFGAGSITIEGAQVLIEGWQRTWLGAGQQAEIEIPVDRIRNVYSDHEWLSFDVRHRFWWPRHYMMRADEASAASAMARLLPSSRSKWFEKQATDICDFYRHLRAPGRKPWVTPLLVLACLGIYLVQAATGGYWLDLTGMTLFNWGANVGPLTVHGAWWRLLASIFLHAGLLHLAVNMWVLWSAGRLTESLFGNRIYAVIYFAAGLVGGLLSIAWNPAVSTVGASGAIFGILGAFIAYLVHGGTRIPRHVLRAHLVPTLLFTIFSILNGLGQTGINNAAHFGGLLTGFLLGLAFTAPSNRQAPRYEIALHTAEILVVIVAATGLLFQITGDSARPSVTEQFAAANDWYIAGEAKNLLRWQEIGNQVSAGNISNSEIERTFEAEIIPFWRDAEPRLRRSLPATQPSARAFAATVADFAGARLRWARAIVQSARTNNSQAAIDLAEKTDVVQARLDWFGLRSQYDHQAHSLSESAPVALIENIAWLNYRPCVKYPLSSFNAVSPSDAPADGPARNMALECQAQHLFLTRNFRKLETLLEAARLHPDDQMDGSSSYQALVGGLDDLFQYGGLSLDAVMTRLADWRLEAPGSVEADLAEVSAIDAWAYSARGLGTADTITAQNQVLFSHRIDIAKAALAFMDSRGRDYAQWYADSIEVNLLGNGKEEERQAIFSRAHALFPDDLSIDTEMLHAMMPRWAGSFEKVAHFIAEQAEENRHAMSGEERYARLYWSYATLEGPNADIFKDVYAKPDIISLGMAIMMKRYPKSDYIANVAGRLACESNQRLEYVVFHDAMPKRYSASAWSPDFTVESCNRKFALKP